MMIEHCKTLQDGLPGQNGTITRVGARRPRIVVFTNPGGDFRPRAELTRRLATQGGEQCPKSFLSVREAWCSPAT